MERKQSLVCVVYNSTTSSPLQQVTGTMCSRKYVPGPKADTDLPGSQRQMLYFADKLEISLYLILLKQTDKINGNGGWEYRHMDLFMFSSAVRATQSRKLTELTT